VHGPGSILILGVDPGGRVTGWGVIGLGPGGKLSLVACGTSRPPEGPKAGRLARIQEDLLRTIAMHSPDEAAVEDVFVAGNARTALALGEARGVVLAAAAMSKLPVFEYPPSQVKKAVCASGAADKRQVAAMVRRLLAIGATERLAVDTTDALAVAICHAHSRALRQVARAAGVSG
jgi:crossover junction endodeoxyribonuclease RuvC